MFLSKEVFERFEKKYLIDEVMMLWLLRKMEGRLERDVYADNDGAYSITNIYYDTKDSHLIRTSISKPRYKEKLRLRCYGTPASLDDKAYVEIKKKFNGQGNKRRSAMRLGDAYRFMESGEIPAQAKGMNMQVLREIQYMLQLNRLRPMLYLSYDRLAFQGTDGSGLRITFDHNILTRRADLRLESGAYGQSLLPGNKWLMEIKVPSSIPMWLSSLLSAYRLYPCSFSKYGTEYKNTIEKEINIGLRHIDNI